jgi:elongation factor Ts
MADITAAMVKELRETTGVGMMDCKKALQETGGDFEAAIDWLRTKGLSKAAKKADRVAAEGAVAVATRKVGAGMVAAAVELNAETDFVARNEQFQNVARAIAEAALDAGDDIEAIKAAKTASGETVEAMITNLIATVGENMVLRRAKVLRVEAGAIGSYVHNAAGPNVGRMGVLAAVQGTGDQAALQELAYDICLHVAAFNPLSLSADDMDPAAVEREKAIYTEQALASGRPANIAEKMVEGRMRKFYEEVVLLKQAFVKDTDVTVEQRVADTGKRLGAPATLVAFARLALGEGVDKPTGGDFAAEVAAMTGQS